MTKRGVGGRAAAIAAPPRSARLRDEGRAGSPHATEIPEFRPAQQLPSSRPTSTNSHSWWTDKRGPVRRSGGPPAPPGRSSAASLLVLVHLISLVERRSRVSSFEKAEVELEHDQLELRSRIAWLSECLAAGVALTAQIRPKRNDVLAGTELARAPRRLLLAWESGSLVARFYLSAADRPKRESQCRQCGRIRLPLRRRIVGLPRIAASSCGCELAAGRSARSSISIDRALWCHRFTSRSDQWSAARTPGTGFRTGASRTTGARAKGSRWS